MAKRLTPSQILGEIGEAAARLRFLSIGFQFDARSRLEAGIDGIAEIMDHGQPMAKMIAVQVKATDSGRYSSEDDSGFNYLLRMEDLEYWRGSNLPVIIILYRKSDESFFWKEVPKGSFEEARRLRFDKSDDTLNANSVDRLAALTVPKSGFGYYVPPLGGGEEALVNMLPLALPSEMFVASTSFSSLKAISALRGRDEPSRFDWVINGTTFWSFHDPRTSCCRHIVDLDQVEAIDTEFLALHEEVDEQNKFSYLLNKTLLNQYSGDLRWNKEQKILYLERIQKIRLEHFIITLQKTRQKPMSLTCQGV